MRSRWVLLPVKRRFLKISEGIEEEEFLRQGILANWIASLDFVPTKLNNVEWSGRDYDTDDFFGGDPVNQALSAGNVCLYGLAVSVICALGCSPGLGFIHVGHEFSFAYDIADLYRAEITIPLAFRTAAEEPPDLPNVVRRRVRDIFMQTHILERMVRDIKYLLDDTDTDQIADIVLWDDHHKFAEHGISYGKGGDDD